jgi:hypothetical protein
MKKYLIISSYHEMAMNEYNLMIFVVIFFLVAIMFYSSFSVIGSFAAIKSNKSDTLCTKNGVPVTSGPDADQCCYFDSLENEKGESLGTFKYCADCRNEGGQLVCDDFECCYTRPLPEGDLPQAETVEPSITLPDDNLPTLEADLLPGGNIPTLREGQNLPELAPICPEGQELNEDTNLCVPTDCPEGQVLDEEAGICVPEEPEVAEEQDEPEQQQSEPEEQDQQQPSEEGENSEDSTK